MLSKEKLTNTYRYQNYFKTLLTPDSIRDSHFQDMSSPQKFKFPTILPTGNSDVVVMRLSHIHILARKSPAITLLYLILWIGELEFQEASVIIASALNTYHAYVLRLFLFFSASFRIRLAPCGRGAEIYYSQGSVRYGLTRRC